MMGKVNHANIQRGTRERPSERDGTNRKKTFKRKGVDRPEKQQRKPLLL